MSESDAGLGHVQLEVGDLDRAVAFYRRFLGLEVSERMESRKGRVVLLSGGDRHREVVLRAVPREGWSRGGDVRDGDGGAPGADGTGDDGTSPPPGSPLSAPFQVGFEVPDRRALSDLFFELRKEGVPTTAVDHGVSWSVYFRDPDGHALEAYWDTRAEGQGRDRWDGRSTLLSVDRLLSEDRVRELAERARRAAEDEESGDADDASGDAAAGAADSAAAEPGAEHDD